MQTQQNIRLEGKPSSARWLIPLIILIVLAALAWAYLASKNTTPTTQPIDQTTTQQY